MICLILLCLRWKLFLQKLIWNTPKLALHFAIGFISRLLSRFLHDCPLVSCIDNIDSPRNTAALKRFLITFSIVSKSGRYLDGPLVNGSRLRIFNASETGALLLFSRLFFQSNLRITHSPCHNERCYQYCRLFFGVCADIFCTWIKSPWRVLAVARDVQRRTFGDTLNLGKCHLFCNALLLRSISHTKICWCSILWRWCRSC